MNTGNLTNNTPVIADHFIDINWFSTVTWYNNNNNILVQLFSQLLVNQYLILINKTLRDKYKYNFGWI